MLQRVRLDVDIAGVVHLPDLVPGAGPVGDVRRAVVGVERRGDEGDGGLPEGAQERERHLMEIARPVVEAKDDGARWRRPAPPQVVEQGVGVDRDVVVPLQEAQVGLERLAVHGVIPEDRDGVAELRRPLGEDEARQPPQERRPHLGPVLLPALVEEAHGKDGAGARRPSHAGDGRPVRASRR